MNLRRYCLSVTSHPKLSIRDWFTDARGISGRDNLYVSGMLEVIFSSMFAHCNSFS